MPPQPLTKCPLHSENPSQKALSTSISSVDITQLVSPRLHSTLNSLMKQICEHFPISIHEISKVDLDNEAWKVLETEELGLPIPEEDWEDQAAMMVIRVQKALLNVFHWADHFDVQDESKIHREFFDAFVPLHISNIHDFNWRSNGASRIISGELEYEGSGEMPNDGFSIQSEARILRPFDRD